MAHHRPSSIVGSAWPDDGINRPMPSPARYSVAMSSAANPMLAPHDRASPGCGGCNRHVVAGRRHRRSGVPNIAAARSRVRACRCGSHCAIRRAEAAGKSRLDPRPAHGVVGVVSRQTPDAMEVFWQHDCRDHVEGLFPAGIGKGRAKCVDVLHQKATMAIAQVDGEEPDPSWKVDTAIVGHAATICAAVPSSIRQMRAATSENIPAPRTFRKRWAEAHPMGFQPPMRGFPSRRPPPPHACAPHR